MYIPIIKPWARERQVRWVQLALKIGRDIEGCFNPMNQELEKEYMRMFPERNWDSLEPLLIDETALQMEAAAYIFGSLEQPSINWCEGCHIELCNYMDAYYGKEESLKEFCSKCRANIMNNYKKFSEILSSCFKQP